MDNHEDPEAAVRAALGMDASVLCLQEVPRQVLPLLYRLRDYNVIVALDSSIKEYTSYLAIIVHKSVTVLKRRKILHEHHPNKPWYARRFKWAECLGSLSILIRAKGRKIRVLNCHAPLLSSILERRRIIDRILHTHRCRNPLIVCADLNMIGFPGFNATIGQFFGIELSEILMDEDDEVDRLAAQYKLRRVFKRGVVTYPLLWDMLGGQPDHILVDEQFPVVKSMVIPERFGSDHYPLLAELRVSNP